MTREELKTKFEIILRSAAQFVVLSLMYIVLRGLIGSAINGDVEPMESARHLEFAQSFMKGFLFVGSVVIVLIIWYDLGFGVRQKPNYKIVVPFVMLFILFLELFLF